MSNELEEALSPQERRKKARVMKRHAKKIAAARKRKSKRKATPEKLKSRARKKAIQKVRQMVAGKKGSDYNALSPAEKSMIDTKVQKRKSAIDRLTRKMLPKVRKTEKARMSGKRVNEEFENLFEASENDTKPKKRFHQLMSKNGSVKHDKRFKMYKQTAVHEDIEDMKKRHAKQDDRLDARQKRQIDRAKVRKMRDKIRATRMEDLDWENDQEVLNLVDNISESIENDYEKILSKLDAKASDSGYLPEIIEEVYNRGVETYDEDVKHLTVEQYAMNRVNSFINEGEAFELDSDILEESEILGKALEAIRRQVGSGMSIQDATWEISKARGVNMRPKELAKAYAKKYPEPEKTNLKPLTKYQKSLYKKYGFTGIEESKNTNKMDLGTFTIYKSYKKPGEFGVSQTTKKNDYPWDHSAHDGYFKSVKDAKKYIEKRAGTHNYRIKISEETQLDEVSNETLRSYMKKATASLKKNVRKADYNDKKGRYHVADKHYHTATKRKTGIDRAKTLTKEETQLDEISFEKARDARDSAFKKMVKGVGSTRKNKYGNNEYVAASDESKKRAVKAAKQARKFSNYMVKAKERDGKPKPKDIFAKEEVQWLDEGLKDLLKKIQGVNEKDIIDQVSKMTKSELSSVVSKASPRSARRTLDPKDYALWSAAYKRLSEETNTAFETMLDEADKLDGKKGAGEWGTDKLKKKYKKDTPGQ